MAFSDAQVRKLRATLSRRHVREREFDGKTLLYLEGWHVVSEANRIFGFDGWDRETVANQCVFEKQIDGRFCVSYLTRVRIGVRAGGTLIIREGLGSGDATAQTYGQAHERAGKAAETDATKRALSTFGSLFGLSLYRNKEPREATRSSPANSKTLTDLQITPPVHEGSRGHIASMPGINKSRLTFGEPERLRDKTHLRFVATQPCVVCRRLPCHAHHLRIAQLRALGRKVSDEFTVPLCVEHHRELHMRGDESAWWHDHGIKPLPIAEQLWHSQGQAVPADAAE